nr:MAG TPA: hypothetical protein [Caudoviricetes sp.]
MYLERCKDKPLPYKVGSSGSYNPCIGRGSERIGEVVL